MSLKNIFILFLFLFFQISYSQEHNLSLIDSLEKLDTHQLVIDFYELYNINKKRDSLYAEVILRKYKKNKTRNIVYGYEIMAQVYGNNLEKHISYIDSAIVYSEESKIIDYPTKLYVNKGFSYASKAFFNEALDSYLKGLEFAKKKNDSVYEYIIYHNIALLKRRIGKYNEAKILLKKCLVYEKTKLDTLNFTSYLATLSELVITHRRNKEIDSALLYNKEGLTLAKKSSIKSYFILNDGILDYYCKNYNKSITKIKEAFKKNSESKKYLHFENYNIIDGYYYLGESYNKIGDTKKSITYFKKVDSLINSTDYLIPEIRSSYTAIIDYYKSKNDTKQQLYYITRLLKYDSILDHNLVDLNIKLERDYDTPNLVFEKERLINTLKIKNKESNIYLILAIIIIIITSTLLIFNFKNKKKYKSRFEKLMNSNQAEKLFISKEKNKKEKGEKIPIGISSHVIDKILASLDEFEKQNGFNKVNLTTNILAKQMQTNSKYLTRVIKHYKQKNFSPYINDLRINYIINELKKNHTLRNYTIKAIATEAGFNSPEVFSKYFHKKTGIYPSYFIKKLQNPDR
ncbi:AraC family transcriptional regulator [uncultured Dokdonia sp.]|uniref:AraC family transcriptional regulator n=1 Tax=uncultured Dokdonia sp. TaxID=575653 RepID=UPI0026162138|nr:AraC family transcriptional regulator [uncultured Dokdonia sp.]